MPLILAHERQRQVDLCLRTNTTAAAIQPAKAVGGHFCKDNIPMADRRM